MDELIIRVIRAEASEAEWKELRRWRRAARENERRFQEIRALWAVTGESREAETGGPVPRARDVVGMQAVGASRIAPAGGGRSWGRVGAWAGAAVLLVALAVGAVLAVAPGEDAPEATVTIQDFQTGPNELTTAVLEDGSVVRLGPGTTLSARFENGKRTAELDGRAFFVVTEDEERPFRVTTAQGEAHVLGTRFEMDNRRNGLRLLVVDGKVGISAAGGMAELEAGDLGRAPADAPPLVERVEDPEAFLDWMGAWVAFESTPLRRVARELEVRLGLQVEIADASLEGRTISGWFAEEDADTMVSLICRVADIRCAREGDLLRME